MGRLQASLRKSRLGAKLSIARKILRKRRSHGRNLTGIVQNIIRNAKPARNAAAATVTFRPSDWPIWRQLAIEPELSGCESGTLADRRQTRSGDERRRSATMRSS
jgi:hypothetical protein